MTNLEKLQDLYAKIGQGKAMEGFEAYYADNVKVIEPNGEVRDGKEAQRQAINQWFGMIQEMHGGGSGNAMTSADGNTTSIESWFDNTFKDGNRVKMEEVAVQKWENGQIVEERFYYNMPASVASMEPPK